jgi:hypothetical protein
METKIGRGFLDKLVGEKYFLCGINGEYGRAGRVRGMKPGARDSGPLFM